MRIENNSTLMIKSSFFDGKEIQFKEKLLMKVIILSLFNELIKGDNSYFYTHKNVIYDSKTHELYTNTTSNVGLLFLLKKKQMEKK